MKRLILAFGFLLLILTVFADKIPFLKLNSTMHHSEVRDLAVSEQSDLLLSVSYDKTVKVWDRKTLELVKTLHFPIEPGNAGKLICVAISPDGTEAAISAWRCSWEETDIVYIINLQSYTISHIIRGFKNTVYDLEYSPDGEYLLCAVGNREGLRIFKTGTYALTAKTEEIKVGVNSAVFSSDGTKIVAITNTSDIVQYTFEDGKIAYLNHLHYDNDNAVPFRATYSPDDKMIAVGFIETLKLHIYDAETLKTAKEMTIPQELEKEDAQLHDIYWSSDGKTLFAANYNQNGDGGLVILTYEEGGVVKQLKKESGVLDIKRVDHLVYFATEYAGIGVYDSVLDQIITKETDFFDYKASYVRFECSNDGMMVKLPTKDLSLYFDLKNAKVLSQTNQQTDFITPMTYSETLPVKDWRLSYFPRLGKTDLIMEFGEHSRCLAINPAETGFALGADWNLYYFDQGGKILWKQPTNAIVCGVNIVKNGRIVVAALGDGTIQWYNSQTGEKLASLLVYKDKTWVFWTPEGYYTGSEEQIRTIGWQKNLKTDQLAAFYPLEAFNHDYRIQNLPAIILQYETKISDMIDENQTINDLIAQIEEKKENDKQTTNYVLEKGDLYLILCAAEKNQSNQFLPLNYAIDDAEAFEALLFEKDYATFETINLYQLYDEEFNNKSLQGIFDEISTTASANDTILFFYAGHGTLTHKSAGEYCYLLKYPAEEGGLSIKALSQYLNGLKTHNIICLIDACNSGAAVDFFIKKTIQQQIAKEKDHKNLSVITSGKQWQKSAEIPDLQHGLFTYSLLKVLHTTESLDLALIADQLKFEMAELSEKYLEEAAFPSVYFQNP